MITYCWGCLKEFESENAGYCFDCTTLQCPHCGICFCKLSPEAQNAVTAAMVTYGHWALGQNPRKKKSGLVEDLYLALLEKGLVKSYEDFLARHEELYKSHPEILEEVRRLREKSK